MQASVEKNIAFGRKQVNYTLSLAARLESNERPATPRELLRLAGEIRMAGAQSAGSEGGAMSRPLATKVKLRDSSNLANLHTALSGKYGRQWNETLRRRIEQGRHPALFEPRGNAIKGSEQTERARLCGAVVTHDLLPWRRCEAFLTAHSDDIEVPTGAGPTRDRHSGIERVRYIDARSDKCRVVLNRMVARSVFDGILLGLNCWDWYGARLMNFESRLFGNLNHASPIVAHLVQTTFMADQYEAFLRARAALTAAPHASSHSVLADWKPLQRSIASFFWCGGLATSTFALLSGLFLPSTTALQPPCAFCSGPTHPRHSPPPTAAGTFGT